jgi:hypothetical protein
MVKGLQITFLYAVSRLIRVADPDQDHTAKMFQSKAGRDIDVLSIQIPQHYCSVSP